MGINDDFTKARRVFTVAQNGRNSIRLLGDFNGKILLQSHEAELTENEWLEAPNAVTKIVGKDGGGPNTPNFDISLIIYVLLNETRRGSRRVLK